MVSEEDDENEEVDTCDCVDFRYCAKYLTGRCVRDYTAKYKPGSDIPKELDGNLDWALDIEEDWFDQ